ncbi:MAG: exonuclease domain-containing protein [Halofilum sp. (in: g-proteobacteria)]|nr:exonuclease domain-containing protein [Halofilum sp. (in: g-proteobacteria)]
MSTHALPGACLPGQYAFVDLETTGCDPGRDRIIELAVVAVDDGRVVDEWSSLVDPGTRIAPTIEGLTGIGDAMVASAPAFTALRDELRARLRGRVLAAHNARFDYGFLRNAFAREGVGFRAPLLCTLRLARSLYPRLRRLGLERGSGTRPRFARQLRRCHGACTGARGARALQPAPGRGAGAAAHTALALDGSVAIPEEDPATGRAELHVVDRWRYLGSTREPSELGELARASAGAPFDRDHYRLLARWLARHPGKARPLARPGAPATA